MTSIAPQPDPALPHRILVVDDEEIVLLSLKETLRREGYRSGDWRQRLSRPGGS